MKVLVFGLKPWEMVDEKTGVVRSGAVLEYLDLEYKEDSDKYTGLKTFKTGKPADVSLPQVPGLYEFEMRPMQNNRGRMELGLASAKFLGAVDFGKVVSLPPTSKKAANA